MSLRSSRSKTSGIPRLWNTLFAASEKSLREAIEEINKRHRTSLSAADYAIDELLIGWEIWGPFRTDIRLGGLSLQATPGARP